MRIILLSVLIFAACTAFAEKNPATKTGSSETAAVNSTHGDVRDVLSSQQFSLSVPRAPLQDHRGTNQEPLVIKPTKSADDENRENRKEFLDELLAWGTIALAAFTLFLWHTTRKMAKEGRAAAASQSESAINALKLSERSVKASEDMAGTMQETAKRELRAYVSLEGTTPDHDPMSQSLGITVQSVNAGKTPAYDLVGRIQTEYREFPLNGPLTARPEPAQLPTSVLGPGQRHIQAARVRPIVHQRLEEMAAGTHALYVKVSMRYQDAFGDPRTTDYLLVWQGTDVLKAYHEGNRST